MAEDALFWDGGDGSHRSRLFGVWKSGGFSWLARILCTAFRFLGEHLESDLRSTEVAELGRAFVATLCILGYRSGALRV